MVIVHLFLPNLDSSIYSAQIRSLRIVLVALPSKLDILFMLTEKVMISRRHPIFNPDCQMMELSKRFKPQGYASFFRMCQTSSNQHVLGKLNQIQLVPIGPEAIWISASDKNWKNSRNCCLGGVSKERTSSYGSLGKANVANYG